MRALDFVLMGTAGFVISVAVFCVAWVARAKLSNVFVSDLRDDFNRRWLDAHPEVSGSGGIQHTFQQAQTLHPYVGASPLNFLHSIHRVANMPVGQIAFHADIVTMACIHTGELAQMIIESEEPARTSEHVQPIQGMLGNMAYVSLFSPSEDARSAALRILETWKSRVLSKPDPPIPHSAPGVKLAVARSRGDLVGMLSACVQFLI
jgi:hypothetical protein